MIADTNTIESAIAEYNKRNKFVIYEYRTIADGYDLVSHTRIGGLVKQSICQCVQCGIRGQVVLRHRGVNEPQDTVHHDIFAIKNGNLLMMTKDHILPKSWGGTNDLSNAQIMCAKCNNSKSNVLTHEQLATIVDKLDQHIAHNQYSKLIKYAVELDQTLRQQNNRLLTVDLVENIINKLNTHVYNQNDRFNKVVTQLQTYKQQITSNIV